MGHQPGRICRLRGQVHRRPRRALLRHDLPLVPELGVEQGQRHRQVRRTVRFRSAFYTMKDD